MKKIHILLILLSSQEFLVQGSAAAINPKADFIMQLRYTLNSLDPQSSQYTEIKTLLDEIEAYEIKTQVEAARSLFEKKKASSSSDSESVAVTTEKATPTEKEIVIAELQHKKDDVQFQQQITDLEGKLSKLAPLSADHKALQAKIEGLKVRQIEKQIENLNSSLNKSAVPAEKSVQSKNELLQAQYSEMSSRKADLDLQKRVNKLQASSPKNNEDEIQRLQNQNGQLQRAIDVLNKSIASTSKGKQNDYIKGLLKNKRDTITKHQTLINNNNARIDELRSHVDATKAATKSQSMVLGQLGSHQDENSSSGMFGWMSSVMSSLGSMIFGH